MKKVLKQTLSVFLAVVMTFTITLPAFAEDATTPETQTEQTTEYNGTNALGQVVSDAINESGATDSVEDNYYIQDVIIEEYSYATAVVSAPDNASLIIAIYDETTGGMVTSAKTEVSSETDVAEVVFEDGINSEFFTVKAFLINAENEPVCKNYETMKYTEAFQEYLAKTTADFEADKVINLDDSEDNNFAVVADDAEVVYQSGDANILVTNDFEHGIYVFENATEEITSLSVGDIIYFVYGEGEEDYILDKIGTIENDNGTVTITANDDFQMSDFFKYIKIDTEKSQTDSPETYVMTLSGDDESGDLDETVETFVIGFNLEFDVKDDEKVKFSGDMTVETTLQYYYDLELFGEDYYEVTCKIDTKLEGKVEIEIGEKKEFNPEPVFEGTIPVIAGVDLVFTFEIRVEFEGKLTVSGTFEYSQTTGCKRIADRPKEDLSKKGEFKLKADVEGEATFRIVPAISAGIKIFKVITISAELNVMFAITAKVHVGIESGTDILNPDSKHDCLRCVDGDILLSTNIEFKIEIGFKRAKVTIAEIKYEFWQKKLCDFYVQMDVSGLIIGFGLSECPNYRYKTTFKVVDNKNNPIQGVMISDGTTKYTTDSKGEAIGYYKNGTYSVTAVNGNYSIDTSKMKSLPIKFGIYSQPNTVNIYMVKNLVGDENGIADAGIAGDNITWTLSADGTLDIQGTGKMTDWVDIDSDDEIYAPWYDYASQIKKVNIASGITSIGGGAFVECENLTEVNIPDSVNYIGDYVFAFCCSLTEIKIPEKVNHIGHSAFEYCSSLVSVNLSDNIIFLGANAFAECEKLNTIKIPNKLTELQEQVFAGTGISSVTIPDSVKYIWSSFSDCQNLKQINWGRNVQVLAGTFEGCTGLTSITLPDSLLSISGTTFRGCTNLSSVKLNENLREILIWSFTGCTSLTSITIPKNVDRIHEEVFADCTSLKTINVDSANQYYSSDANGVLYNKNKTQLIAYPAGNSLSEYVIPESVIDIEYGAFRGCVNLKKLTLPGTLNASTMLHSDVSGCDSLETVIIADGIRTIPQYMFRDMPNLKNIVLPDSVIRINAYAFSNCPKLTSIDLPTNIMIIDTGTFYGCTNLKNVIIPSKVGTIGVSAFYGCNNLETVYFEGSQSQWESITINSGNDNISQVNIVYNYIPTATASVMSLRSISPFALNENLKTESIDDAIEGNEYIIAVVRVSDAYDLLADYNLIYIDQQTATDKNVTFEYVVGEDETEYKVVVLGERLPHEHNYIEVTTKEPTCTETGVKTFTCECGDSYTEEIEMLDHEYESAVTAPTCTEQGFTTYTCSCGDSYVDDYVDATGHTDEVIPGYGATCTDPGLSDGVKCSVCGEVTSEQEIIPVIEHDDTDSDGYCDECGEDLTVNCSHFCHSDGFIGFFWKIINFLQKLFGVQSSRYCECGVDHWSK